MFSVAFWASSQLAYVQAAILLIAYCFPYRQQQALFGGERVSSQTQEQLTEVQFAHLVVTVAGVAKCGGARSGF
jgi:hypothetical protein